MDNFENLDQVLSEIERLREGYKILEEIWTYIEPYSDNVTVKHNGPEIMKQLRSHFKFDDSD